MFIVIVFVSCLYYSLCLGQMDMNSTQPSIGMIYPIANNDSLLNITLNYPLNYQFENLTVNFTIYDFHPNDTANPIIYGSFQMNFNNSNISYTWVVPEVILLSGSYIIVCFQWVQTNFNGTIVDDTYDCTLIRTAVDGSLLPMDSPSINALMIQNTTLIVSGRFPRTLPFDQTNITSTLNNTIMPLVTNSTSNENYLDIRTFTFENLVPDTYYIACINFSYANSIVRGFVETNGECRMIKTLVNHGFINSYNQFLVNIILIILLFLFVSI